MSCIVSVDGIELTYPTGGFRLSMRSFQLAAGEICTLSGPSGSGKSTFLRLLAGELTAGVGRVTVDGVDWATLSEGNRRGRRRRIIGQIFQEARLLEWLTLRENILLPCTLNSSRPEIDLAALAQRMGIADLLGRYPGQVSGGEAQRAAVLRSLVTRPTLVLADEPTASLDSDNARRTASLIAECCGDAGAALLMVTHDEAVRGLFPRQEWLPEGAKS